MARANLPKAAATPVLLAAAHHNCWCITAARACAEAGPGAKDPTRPCNDAEVARALACPCLDDLKAGPCSERFVESFTCFLKHKHEEPGTFCYPVFEKLHACVNEHRKHFKEVFAS